MPSKLPLAGKTIVLTGSTKTQSIIEQIEDNGGTVAVFPLIKTVEILAEDDAEQVNAALTYDWLIFTSQNAVEAFVAKMKRAKIHVNSFRCQIAAVGTKTAAVLEMAGFSVHFMPSIYSADVFVKEFPLVAGQSPNCLFLRGSLAKATLKEGLPFKLDEWTVYETVANTDFVLPFTELLQQTTAIVIFASPSAVTTFQEHIVPIVGWGNVKPAAIGHITAAAIERSGAHVYIMPDTYTMEALLEELVKLEEVQHD